MWRNVLLAAALVVGGTANAAIVYNNGGPDAVGGNETTQWVQAEDFTFAANTTITGVGVYLGGIGSLDNWDGNLQMRFFADAGGAPGSFLAGWSVTPTAIDTGTPWCCGGNAYLVQFSIKFAATAGTTYWMGIHAAASNEFDRKDIYWVTTALNNSSTGMESMNGTLDNWVHNAYEHAFFLESAVPEAATWAMMIAGFGLVGASLRRRGRESLA